MRNTSSDDFVFSYLRVEFALFGRRRDECEEAWEMLDRLFEAHRRLEDADLRHYAPEV